MRRSPLCIGFAFALGLSLALLLLWLLGDGLPFARAAEYRVCPSGCPYSTIQAAVDSPLVGPNDVIKVAAGTYTGVQGRAVPAGYSNSPPGNVITQVVYITKTVTIQGGYTTTNWTTPDPINNPTIVDAQNGGRALFIGGKITPTIEGLRLTGGNATGLGGHTGVNGGGVMYVYVATATLRSNQIFSGTAERGGGVYLYTSQATLDENMVYSNTATQRGGGMYLYTSPATLSQNMVLSNTAGDYGGGLFLYQDNAAVLSDNTLRANKVISDGGGVYLSNSSATLTNNLIADNQANGDGGGVYLYTSPATLDGNTVYSNTATGRGGGMYLYTSQATLDGNTVYSNTAIQRGGGMYLYNSPATLGQNMVISNTASDYGGGLFLYQGNAAVLSDNTVRANKVISDGGGVYLSFSSATLTDNLIADNQANADGGGVYLYTSPATLDGNTVYSNTATGRGGGMYLYTSPATLSQNVVLSNTASDYGGGLFLYQGNAAVLSGNTVRANKVTLDGGGVYLSYSSATLINNVIADNQANGDGSGLCVYSASPRLFHTTFARNTGGTRGISVIDDDVTPSTVAMTNSILVSHTVGIYVTPTNTVIVNGVLWFGTVNNTSGTGAITVTNPYTGNPNFVNVNAGNYHIAAGSAAVDRGVDAGVTTDLDGNPRPQGSAPDLGAYEVPWYTLTVNTTGNGSGVVTPTVGAHSYVSGTTAWLTATANTGSTFAGWSGAVSGMTNPISLTADANKTVTATFNLNTYTLTVATAGNGSGAVIPTVGTHAYDYGTTVWLTATANTGSTFAGWSGAVSGMANPISLTVNANKTVTATFNLNTYTLTVAAAGDGSGAVIPTVGTHGYDYGTTVWLTATANTGSIFAGWSGAVSGTANPISLMMNANKTVTATFRFSTYTLTVATAGNGSGVVIPAIGAHVYDYGATVWLTATANTASAFAGWSGAVSGMTNPISLTMDAAKLVTATFTLQANNPPVANAGPDQTVGFSMTVTLNGSASNDPDNRLPLSYAWTQTGGPNVTFNPALSVTTFTAPGTTTVFTFTLVVTDAWGLASVTPDTVVIRVRYMIYLPVIMRSP